MATLIHTLSHNYPLEIHLALLESGIGFAIPDSVQVHFLSAKKQPSNMEKLRNLVTQAFQVKKIAQKEQFDLIVSFQFRSNFTNVIAKLIGAASPIVLSERAYAKNFYQRKGFAPILNQFLIRRLYPKANHIIVNSTDIKQGLSDFYGVPSELMTVINNGYDKQTIRKESVRDCVPWKEMFQEDEVVLVNVGRVEWEKGQEYLVQVLGELKGKGNFKVLFLGMVREAYRQKLDQISEELGVKDRIVYAGFVSNPYAWVARSDVFVFTSLFEGYPNALAEAIVLHKPAISFDIKAGVSDIIRSEQQGMIVPFGDIKAMAEAVLKVPMRTAVSDDHILTADQSAQMYFDKFEEIWRKES